MKNTIKTGIRFLINTLVFLLMFIYLFYSVNGSGIEFKQHFGYLIAVIIIGNVLGFTILFINRQINKVFRKKNRTGLNFISLLVIDLLLGLFLILIFTRAYLVFFTDIPVETFFTIQKGSVVRMLILSFSVLIIYLIIDFLLNSYNEYSRTD